MAVAGIWPLIFTKGTLAWATNLAPCVEKEASSHLLAACMEGEHKSCEEEEREEEA